MQRVFFNCSYGVLEMEGMFKAITDYCGEIQFEQTAAQSADKVVSIWFFTDKVEIKEGESRQVELYATMKEGAIEINITK